MQCLFSVLAMNGTLVVAADINHLHVETRQACVPISVSPYCKHSHKHAI